MVCLAPALCLGIYPALGIRGSDETGRLYTSFGKVHRHEGGKFADVRSGESALSRLREYHLREIIGFGTEEWIYSMRERAIQFVASLAEAFALPCELSTAADLFLHAEWSRQAIHQLLHWTKLEWRIRLERGPIAVASFNLHGEHFVQEFGIRGPESLQSFCCGFGMERLAQCLVLRRLKPRLAQVEITHEARLSSDLGLDSLLTMDLVLVLEDEFGVTFPDSMLAPENLSTVGRLGTGLQENPGDSRMTPTRNERLSGFGRLFDADHRGFGGVRLQCASGKSSRRRSAAQGGDPGSLDVLP